MTERHCRSSRRYRDRRIAETRNRAFSPSDVVPDLWNSRSSTGRPSRAVPEAYCQEVPALRRFRRRATVSAFPSTSVRRSTATPHRQDPAARAAQRPVAELGIRRRSIACHRTGERKTPPEAISDRIDAVVRAHRQPQVCDRRRKEAAHPHRHSAAHAVTRLLGRTRVPTLLAAPRVIRMPISVHALAHRPLTTAAVAELVALPTTPYVPEDVDAVDAEVRQRGWSWEHELVCDSFRPGCGHVLCTDGISPFGRSDARYSLVFGQLYPVDPDDGNMTNGPWLYSLMDDWQQQPGWSGRRPGTDQDCERVLAQAAQAVTGYLGADGSVIRSDGRRPPADAPHLAHPHPCAGTRTSGRQRPLRLPQSPAVVLYATDLRS